MEREYIVGVVMAHEAVESTVARHLPYWLRICQRLIVVVPLKQRLALVHPDVEVVAAVPDGGAYSPHTNRRAIAAMARGLASHSPYVMLWEYDSIAWGPIPPAAVPEWGGMGGTRFANEERSPVPGKKFTGSFYLHTPNLFTRPALERTLMAAQGLPIDAEHGYTDRFIGLAVERAKVPVTDWNALGLSYSWANISSHPGRVEACRRAVGQGVRFSHGIKDGKALEAIMAAGPWKGGAS